jgi:hypothetical protein
MVRDLALLLRFLAVWTATAKGCAVRAAAHVFSFAYAENNGQLLALTPRPSSLELISVAVPAADPIRRSLRKLASQLQPRAPPVAA